MWNYAQTPTSDELYHYGVLGMKWGVRHDRSKARAKADAKTRKLKKKATQAAERAERMTMEYHRKKSKRPKTEFGVASQEKASRKYNRAQYNSLKAKRKLDRWEKAVDKNFSDKNLAKIDKQRATKEADKRTKQAVKELYKQAYERNSSDSYYNQFSGSQRKNAIRSDTKWDVSAAKSRNPEKYMTSKERTQRERSVRKSAERSYQSSAKAAGVKLNSSDKKKMKDMTVDQLNKATRDFDHQTVMNFSKQLKAEQGSKKKKKKR